jgi:hypothetical protein
MMSSGALRPSSFATVEPLSLECGPARPIARMNPRIPELFCDSRPLRTERIRRRGASAANRDRDARVARSRAGARSRDKSVLARLPTSAAPFAPRDERKRERDGQIVSERRRCGRTGSAHVNVAIVLRSRTRGSLTFTL